MIWCHVSIEIRVHVSNIFFYLCMFLSLVFVFIFNLKKLIFFVIGVCVLDLVLLPCFLPLPLLLLSADCCLLIVCSYCFLLVLFRFVLFAFWHDLCNVYFRLLSGAKKQTQISSDNIPFIIKQEPNSRTQNAFRSFSVRLDFPLSLNRIRKKLLSAEQEYIYTTQLQKRALFSRTKRKKVRLK